MFISQRRGKYPYFEKRARKEMLKSLEAGKGRELM